MNSISSPFKFGTSSNSNILGTTAVIPSGGVPSLFGTSTPSLSFVGARFSSTLTFNMFSSSTSASNASSVPFFEVSSRGSTSFFPSFSLSSSSASSASYFSLTNGNYLSRFHRPYPPPHLSLMHFLVRIVRVSSHMIILWEKYYKRPKDILGKIM